MSISGATPPPVTSKGTTTSYLPLTTTFPSIASCSSLFVNPAPFDGGTLLFAFDPEYAAYVSGAPICQPDVVRQWWGGGVSGIFTTDIGGFSTMACPAMYTTALIQPRTNSTLIACCPSNYDFVVLSSARLPNQCSSIVPKGREVTFMQTDSKGDWITKSNLLTTDSVVFGVQVNGYIFNNAVVPSATKSSSSGLGTPSSTITTAATTGALESGTSSSSNNSSAANATSGLSTGAKVGIGIGAGLGLIGLVSLFVTVMLSRRRKRWQMCAQGSADESASGEDVSKVILQRDELPAQVIHESGGSHEIDSHERFEAGANRARSEMP